MPAITGNFYKFKAVIFLSYEARVPLVILPQCDCYY